MLLLNHKTHCLRSIGLWLLCIFVVTGCGSSGRSKAGGDDTACYEVELAKLSRGEAGDVSLCQQGSKQKRLARQEQLALKAKMDTDGFTEKLGIPPSPWLSPKEDKRVPLHKTGLSDRKIKLIKSSSSDSILPDDGFPEVGLPMRSPEAERVLGNVDHSQWRTVVAGYGMNAHLDKKPVRDYVSYYMQHPEAVERLTRRASQYLPMITQELAASGMPMEVALLPFVESAYQADARSSAGAVGLWQFIPETGERFGLSQGEQRDARLDPEASTKAAIAYLKKLHEMFDKDWLLALAAYNAGEGRVANAVKSKLASGQRANFWNIDLPRETKEYVPRLLAYRELIKDAQDYNLELDPIAAVDKGKTENMIIPAHVELAVLAKKASISPQVLLALNTSGSVAKGNEDTKEIIVPSYYVTRLEKAIYQIENSNKKGG